MCESIKEAIIDQMALIPGLSKEIILHSINEKSFDHISAIYDLLCDAGEEYRDPCNMCPGIMETPELPVSPSHTPCRTSSITTGEVARPTPEIQLFLNDSQIYEKVWKIIMFEFHFFMNQMLQSAMVVYWLIS